MEFKDIPESVQIIAANHLCELLKPTVSGETGEPAIELAGRVSKAFTALYSLSECASVQRDEELKHVIALLLEDAKRLQKIEPNAGTEARIWIAKEALLKSAELDFLGFAAPTNESQAFRQGLQECHCACR